MIKERNMATYMFELNWIELNGGDIGIDISIGIGLLLVVYIFK